LSKQKEKVPEKFIAKKKTKKQQQPTSSTIFSKNFMREQFQAKLQKGERASQ
jgi:hypothetical protein